MQATRPFEYYRDRISSMNIRGGRALDAGCGTGTYAFAMAEFFDRVDGCDISEGRIALARLLAERNELGNVHFSVGSVLELPYEDASFDLVFCYGVVVSYISLATVLREFRRVLKPGGKLYMGLNGIGFYHFYRETRVKGDEELDVRTSRTFYSSYIRNRTHYTADHVRKLWARVTSPKARYLMKARRLDRFVARGGSAKDVFQFLGDRETNEIAALIEEDCGPAFVDRFADDLIRIRTGQMDDFSFPNAGRAYDPRHVGDVMKSEGFVNYRWAEELQLFDTPAAVIELDRVLTRKLRYDGYLARWELIATKPPGSMIEGWRAAQWNRRQPPVSPEERLRHHPARVLAYRLWHGARRRLRL